MKGGKNMFLNLNELDIIAASTRPNQGCGCQGCAGCAGAKSGKIVDQSQDSVDSEN